MNGAPKASRWYGGHGCYVGAAAYAMRHPRDTVLVHARTAHRDYHAWVEIPALSLVFDPVWDRLFPLRAYRAAVGVVAEDRRDGSDVARKVLTEGRPGPWLEDVTRPS